jgi:hypothetical protein
MISTEAYERFGNSKEIKTKGVRKIIISKIIMRI